MSMEEALLAEFDKFLEKKGYSNRSEALRDLVKKNLIDEKSGNPDVEVSGTITMIYPYRLKLKPIHTDSHPSNFILANLHVHLDKEICLKVIVVKGKAKDVRDMADRLLGTKGVLGQLTLCATEDLYQESMDEKI